MSVSLKLFYRRGKDIDWGFVDSISNQGVDVECLCVDDHREQYDHDDLSLAPSVQFGYLASCFCDEPDYDDQTWPKLHHGYKNLIASGKEEILALDLSKFK